MKILVIGANGQLGWELCRKGTEEGFDIIPLDLPDFDITKRSAVNKAVTQNGASLIINAAAYTAVDEAESEPELAFAVNRDGPAYLASSCAKAGIPLIHISTDYVFDGNKKGPYLEIDTVSPLGVYGKSKAAGEAEVRGHLPSH
ncbi:MAG: sugar nucleotide-binding protein, partial [Deltaproteobacteria bacterium]|nr:sugar nucleotide-binding protein [Deltaproteobacteria bacterium]